MVKKTASSRSFVGLLFKRLAAAIGAEVTLEPRWKTVGQIKFADGRKRYFRYSSVDLNTLGSAEISKDKAYAAYFMRRMGYPAIQGRTFYSDAWAKAIKSKDATPAALRYAKGKYPLFVKPNDGSQGYGVALVHSEKDLRAALKRIFAQTEVALIQKPARGRDYRIVVLDGEVISAYERIPLSVRGDGRSTIKTLLATKQREFDKSGRDTKIKTGDPRIHSKLKSQGMSMASRPKAGEKVFLLDNANLSTGGDSVDVTKTMHDGFKQLAINLTRDMGLRICGVDMMITGDIAQTPKRYRILETNAAPGLDHYVKTGAAQEKIVDDLYRKVLLAMTK